MIKKRIEKFIRLKSNNETTTLSSETSNKKICMNVTYLPWTFNKLNRCAGSDDSKSASGSAGPIPGEDVNIHLKIFNLGARRGGDVHFLIARLYITGLD